VIKLYVIGCFLIGAIFTGFGDYASKKWVTLDSWWWLALAYGSYILGVSFWFLGFRQSGEISKMALVWAILLAVAAILIGIVGFGERPTTTNLVGIGLGILSMVLIML
jgi:uncharacterized membrane protein